MPAIDPKTLHPDATFLRVLGVNYVHINTLDGGDLYVTAHGVPFLRQLAPECWYEESWFKAHRARLEGSGTVYRVPTKPVDGLSIDLVVKWSRVGQDVPLNTMGVERNPSAEFNTPFEEFALVEELRRGGYEPPGRQVLTQKPLAITSRLRRCSSGSQAARGSASSQRRDSTPASRSTCCGRT